MNLRNISELLDEVDKSPIAHFATAKTQYRNDAKVNDLFAWTLRGVTEIVEMAKESDEAKIKGAAEAGISTGIIEFFLKLKANVSASVMAGDEFTTIVRREIQGPWKMVLAETVLQSENLVADEVHGEFGYAKPYVRIRDVFTPFPPKPDDVLKLELIDLLGQMAAETIIERKQEDERGHPDTPQFVYATNEPFPMASLLFAPPQPELGIDGDSWACYPVGPGWNRIYFGTLAAPYKGVTFVDLFYVVDVFSG